jgi:hypothetical protein
MLPIREITPTIDGMMIGNLHDPRNCRTSRRLEELGLLKDPDKNILAHIGRLGVITQDSPADVKHCSPMPPEQDGESLPGSLAHTL